MKIGIVSEGPDDMEIIKQIVKCVKGIDTSEMIPVLPKNAHDQTDNIADNYSNWELVLKEAEEHVLIDQFFETWSEHDPLIVVHIDTAERGQANYNVPEPQRIRNMDLAVYSRDLRNKVRTKIENLIPIAYRQRIAYAIAIEETEAWILPLFENRRCDTASYTDPKSRLEYLLSKDKKLRTAFIDTQKKRPSASKLGKLLCKSKTLKKCQERSTSLSLFCQELAAIQ